MYLFQCDIKTDFLKSGHDLALTLAKNGSISDAIIAISICTKFSESLAVHSLVSNSDHVSVKMNDIRSLLALKNQGDVNFL